MLEDVRAGVCHPVPFLPHVDILEPKVGRKVDDPCSLLEQARGLVHGDPGWCREKDDVAFTEVGRPRIRELQVHAPAKAGEQLRDRHTGLLARGNGLNMYLWMARQDAQELHPRIS